MNLLHALFQFVMDNIVLIITYVVSILITAIYLIDLYFNLKEDYDEERFFDLVKGDDKSYHPFSCKLFRILRVTIYHFPKKIVEKERGFPDKWAKEDLIIFGFLIVWLFTICLLSPLFSILFGLDAIWRKKFGLIQ